MQLLGSSLAPLPSLSQYHYLKNQLSHHPDPKPLFTSCGSVLGSQKIIELSRSGIAGFSLRSTPEFCLKAEGHGVVLECVDVRLVKGPNNIGPDLFLAINTNRGPASGVMPLIGNLFFNGVALTNQQLETISVNVMQDPQGQDLVTPVFAHGGRSVIVPGLFQLAVKRTEHGGFRVLQPEEEADDFLAGCALQFRGCGTTFYTGHLATCNPDGSVQLDPKDQIRNSSIPSNRRYAEVVRPEYKSHSGIFDICHEPYGDSPCGGLSLSAASKDLGIDEHLFGLGARMAGVIVSCGTLLDNVLISERIGDGASLPCDYAAITVRFIFHETMRLDSFLTEECTDEEHFEAIKRFACINFPEDDDPILAYLTALSDNVSFNARICLDNGLAIKRDQRTPENMDRLGRMLDTENCVFMKTIAECLPTIAQWLNDIIRIARKCRYSDDDYYASAAFEKFVCNLLNHEYGAEFAHFVVEELRHTDNSEIKLGRIALDLSVSWIEGWLRQNNCLIDRRAVLDFVADQITRKHLMLEPDQLALFEKMKMNLGSFDQAEMALLQVLETLYFRYAVLSNQPLFGGLYAGGEDRLILKIYERDPIE